MSASSPGIRTAAAKDLPAVMAAMARLAHDLNDPFRASSDMMHDALFGPDAHSVCLLAGEGSPPQGAVLFSPVISTVLGHACLHVSDLWVGEAARGRSIGRRLLAAAANEGARRWQTRALFLNVYSKSTQAMAFYRHLGFRISQTDNRASLTGTEFERLLSAKVDA